MNRAKAGLLGAAFLMMGMLAGCGAQNGGTQETQAAETVVETEAATEEAEAPYESYTIIFDKNTTPDDLTDDESFTYYTTGWGAVQKSSIVEVPYSEDAVIPTDDVPTPSRKGYYFAGWQTEPVVTEDDLVNGVSKYMVFFGDKLSEVGQAKVASSDSAELESRNLYAEAQYIKDFEGLTEDGTLTLYARWVEAKEISDEEGLRSMANDLYGAYVLTDDITLTEEWNPIGAYFTNYEYFNDSWWTYAFRGTLDGNDHTIYGLTVNGADVDTSQITENADAIWHGDGNTADGTPALFGAICGANITNITIDGANINVAGENSFSGKYCYVATLACFDMASTMKNVHITNSTVALDYSDAEAEEGQSMFVVIGGLEAGGWSSTISDSSVTGTAITLNTETTQTHGGEIYAGGLVGECYVTMKNNQVDADVTVNHQDISEAADDNTLTMNVGGISAANTSSSGNTVNARVNVTVVKEQGASEISIGGYAGAQRYLTADGNTVNTVITTDLKLDEENANVYEGAMIGRMDMYYASLILMYADGVTCGTSGNTVDVTLNGEALTDLIDPEGMPMVDGEAVDYMATEDYTDANGVTYKENASALVAAYGSYIPESSMINHIMYIKVE